MINASTENIVFFAKMSCFQMWILPTIPVINQLSAKQDHHIYPLCPMIVRKQFMH